jgi:hypothetical protein
MSQRFASLHQPPLTSVNQDALKQLKAQLEREKSRPTSNTTDSMSREGVRLRSQSSSDVVAIRQTLIGQLSRNWFNS